MEEIIIIPAIFIGLPWLILHYVTKWKTAATLTVDDEAMLEDLYQVAKRLETRLDTVERLVSVDHPEFRPSRLSRDADTAPLREYEQRLMSERTVR